MYQTVNEYAFVRAFDEMNREENFSVGARRELFAYYEDLEDETGEPMELDVIAICCDWQEMTLEEIVSEYDVSVPTVYRYGIDLDERGEFRATVYRVRADGTETEAATVTHDDFEGGMLEGVDPRDAEEVVAELTESADCILTADEEYDFEEEILDELRDHTAVLEVEHYNGPSTYLVQAF